MKSNKLKGYLILFITAAIWGSGFVPQKIAAETISPYAFNGLRYFLGAFLIFLLAKCRLPFRDPNGKWALLAGVVLSCAALLQQIGIMTASVTNTAFITATYIVLVPFLSGLILHKPVPKVCYAAAVLALVGLYLLSTAGKGLDTISGGDIIVFIGSLFWSFHIIEVEKGMSEEGDPVRFSAGQFMVAALIQLLIWVFADHCALTLTKENALMIAYSGIFVIGIAFTLQAVGQRSVQGSAASIILGLESVFGTLFGVILYHETVLPLQILGAALIFAAVILVVRE